MIVKIKRQDNRESKPYWQSFEYNGPVNTSIAHLLDILNFNDDLFDIDGKMARRIQWECSCMQKMCGACAIRICGKPALACNTFIDEIKTDVIVLEPLSKFPVICDLCVDRSAIQAHLLASKAYSGKAGDIDSKEQEHRYQSAKCLKCGLCLEICPNYKNGKRFFGATFANDLYLLYSANGDRRALLKEEYKKHFFNSCSRCLACQNICPMELPMVSSMAKLNRRKS